MTLGSFSSQRLKKAAFPKHATFILTAYIILLPHTNKMVSNDDVNSQLCLLCRTSSAFPTHFSLANISSFFRFDGLLALTLVFSLPQLFTSQDFVSRIHLGVHQVHVLGR